MMIPRLLWAAFAAALLILAGCQPKPGEPQAGGRPVDSLTEDEKAIYAFGLVVGQQVGQQAKQLRLTPAETAVFRDGIGAALMDEPAALEISQYEERFESLVQTRMAAGAAETRAEAASFLASAAAVPGAVRTDSGLVYRTLTPGSGASPKATDTVRVHYHGTLVDGTVFDSSVQRGEPAEFPLNRVITCWTEGVQRMQVGEKAQFVCPAEIAYGDRGAGNDIPPGATLIFEVELLGIQGS